MGVIAPQPGIEPAPPALEGEVLTTGPPGKSANPEIVLFWDLRSVILNLCSSLEVRCFCCRITIWFKISEVVVFENSKLYLIQLVFLKHQKQMSEFWNGSFWKYVQVFGIKYSLLMSYIVLDWFAWLVRAGWPEQDAQRVDRVFISHSGWLAPTRGTGLCEPTLAPGAVLPNVEPAAQKMMVLVFYKNSFATSYLTLQSWKVIPECIPVALGKKFKW